MIDALLFERTSRAMLAALAAVDPATLREWMTKHHETIEASEATGQAAALMIHGGFRHLPVVDDGKVVGIVSIRDLMRVTLEDSAPRGA